MSKRDRIEATIKRIEATINRIDATLKASGLRPDAYAVIRERERKRKAHVP
jgi:hypothetical protein